MIVITGGTGKTGRRLAQQLGDRARVVSRHSQLRFDWQDLDTFGPVLQGARGLYLVAPPGVSELLPVMQPFLEQALAAGVSRFVLLSSSAIEEGGPFMGVIHSWLHRHAPEWVVLRPSWFMQNFSEGPHRQTLEQGVIYSATAEGRVAFIDAEDIAAVASVALTAANFPSGELLLTGPEALSYADVAQILGEQLGRPIRHQNLSQPELAQRHEQAGIPAEYAASLAAMDEPIARGAEDRTSGEVERITGRPPTPFADFAAREFAR